MNQQVTKSIDNTSAVAPRKSELYLFIKVFSRRKLALLGMVLVLIFIIIAIFAPLIAPYDPSQINLAIRLQAPSSQHLLGTDAFGRDILSRIIFGTRTSITIGISAVAISLLCGCLLGLIAVYYGGLTFTVIMRIIDALMSVPNILLVILIAATLGNGMRNVIIALGVNMVSDYCRIMCAQALSVKQNEYITAEHAIGASNMRVMFKHILPNSLAPIIVISTVQLGMAIITEASLSFLGFGIVEPTPAWGSMLNQGFPYLLNDPILSVAPGVAIMLLVFGINLMGDGLRDTLDPRLRGTI
jgi:peptide/nickel transport system permease protein